VADIGDGKFPAISSKCHPIAALVDKLIWNFIPGVIAQLECEFLFESKKFLELFRPFNGKRDVEVNRTIDRFGGVVEYAELERTFNRSACITGREKVSHRVSRESG